MSKFLDHLIIELKSVQDEAYTPSQYWMMPTVLLYVHTTVFSAVSHMHRVIKTLPQEP